ncbi:unnamed protein product [Mycena citricolor]|uniref:Uncharacterized protein n=1 Tax=Mycena citricolor TaxID=2018698 RepID=A0AAD2K3Y5_9AGAR|nr:unnamed protein product [Mycena citricolor]
MSCHSDTVATSLVDFWQWHGTTQPPDPGISVLVSLSFRHRIYDCSWPRITLRVRCTYSRVIQCSSAKVHWVCSIKKDKEKIGPSSDDASCSGVAELAIRIS